MVDMAALKHIVPLGKTQPQDLPPGPSSFTFEVTMHTGRTACWACLLGRLCSADMLHLYHLLCQADQRSLGSTAQLNNCIVCKPRRLELMSLACSRMRSRTWGCCR